MRRMATATLAVALGGCIPQGAEPGYAEPPPPAPRQDQRPVPQRRPAPPAPRDFERQTLDDGVVAPAAPPPAWQARPVVPDARSVSASTYVVQPGDTLGRVVERTGASAEAIARENALGAPYVIRAGQRLSIPGGRYHLVRTGETGIAIARAYGVDWSRIVTANALAEPYVLRVGQRVLIPGDPARPPSAAERAAAFRLDIDDIITGSQPVIAERQRPAAPTTTAKRPLPSVAQVARPTGPAGAFVWPVKGGRIVQSFGPRGSGERSNGIKIAVPIGTPVLAAADGVVAYAGSEVAAFGGLVMVSHGGGLTSVYGHASQLLVTRGQRVKRGQTLALSGDTGYADRPELHFEIRQGRAPLDPLTRLPPR